MDINGIELAQAERETLRWLILLTLNAARPVGAAETLILRTVQDVPLHVTAAQVRRELDYLAGLKLLHLERRDRPVWFAEMLPAGVDIVEYTTDCPAGIARPVKYW